MWRRAVWAPRGLHDVPAGLWPVPYDDDHYHDHTPLQHLLRHGYRFVPRPVFGAVRLWSWNSPQPTLPASHGAAELRPLSGKLSIPTMPTPGMGVPADHHHHLALRRSRSAPRHIRYGDVQEKL